MDTIELRTVTVEDAKTASYFTLTGKCLMCGDCCRLMCKAPFMLNEKGVCRFLGEDNLCDIQAQRQVPTDEQDAYWKQNCETFPVYLTFQDYDSLKAALVSTGWPTANCGYSMEVDDG